VKKKTGLKGGGIGTAPTRLPVKSGIRAGGVSTSPS